MRRADKNCKICHQSVSTTEKVASQRPQRVWKYTQFKLTCIVFLRQVKVCKVKFLHWNVIQYINLSQNLFYSKCWHCHFIYIHIYFIIKYYSWIRTCVHVACFSERQRLFSLLSNECFSARKKHYVDMCPNIYFSAVILSHFQGSEEEKAREMRFWWTEITACSAHAVLKLTEVDW